MKSRIYKTLSMAMLVLTITFQAASARTLTRNDMAPSQISAPAPVERPGTVEDAEFVLVNATSSWLSLFVDGQRTVTVNPGDRGVVLVSVGTHTFRAVAEDGRSVERTGYVSEDGVVWTVSE